MTRKMIRIQIKTGTLRKASTYMAMSFETTQLFERRSTPAMTPKTVALTQAKKATISVFTAPTIEARPWLI